MEKIFFIQLVSRQQSSNDNLKSKWKDYIQLIAALTSLLAALLTIFGQ